MCAYVLLRRSWQASDSHPLILWSAARPRNPGQAGLDGVGKSAPGLVGDRQTYSVMWALD